MTGFGSGRAEAAGTALTVEVRSVNHRYCEVKTRLPRELARLEPGVIGQVKARLHRGSVDVTLKLDGLSAKPAPSLDRDLLAGWKASLDEAARELRLTAPSDLLSLAQLPGVLRLEQPTPDAGTLEKPLREALDAALDALVASRAAEGRRLGEDVGQRLETLSGTVQLVEGLAPGTPSRLRERLESHLRDLGDVAVEPARLAQEVALLAERADISEELTRLRGHLDQMRLLLEGDEPCGRRLDFLCQELHREVNTTGSKSHELAITNAVVELKAELERVREQVQNIE